MKLFNFVAEKVAQFKNNESGVTAIEYAVIGVAISAICLAVFASGGPLEEALNGAMDTIADNINDANG